MKPTCLIFVIAFSSIVTGLKATNLTGEGYIYITKPTTAWTPPSGIYNTPRFLWYPDKAALRFGDLESGTYTSTYWDNSYIGAYSFAAGLNSRAVGDHSFAFGKNVYAGDESIAIGSYSSSNGGQSLAVGYGTNASDYCSTAIGYYAHADFYAIAVSGYAVMDSISVGGTASGTNSIALGWAQAIGNGSVTAGFYSTATGDLAIALGYEAESVADYSVAIGPFAQSLSRGGVALGMNTLSKRMNGANASPTTPQADDPVFMVSQAELGTEPGDTATANALTIYRNGAAHFNGIVRVKAGGDISMGAYTTKPSGVSFP